MVWAQGSLYIGGSFTAVGGVTARNVARWDGHRWHSLGTGDENGVGAPYRFYDGHWQYEYDAGVRALAVAPNGDVYVGGDFDRAGRVSASCLARWDGRRWSAVGDFRHLEDSISLQRDAQAARRWEQTHRFNAEDDQQENRYPLAPPPRRVVRALAVAADGTLYAGGTFQYAASAYPADTVASSVARWNGRVWTVPGQGVPGTVNALVAAVDGRVYAGGDLWDGQPAELDVRGRVACWDGTTWLTIGTSHNYYGSEIGQGIYGEVQALAVAPGGEVYAAGDSRNSIDKGQPAGNVARWNGHAWQLLGLGPYRGIIGTVKALAVASGRVYAAGNFQQPGTWKADDPWRGSRIATWDGRVWQPLDPALPTNPVRPSEQFSDVAALVVAPTGEVYAGGRLLANGSSRGAQYLDRWAGHHWDGLPQAGAQGVNGDVLAVAVAAGGRVYVGGSFGRVGNAPARSLACWNGRAWKPLPLGCLVDNAWGPVITALAVATDGQLYAGAGAYSQGPQACRVARWDGRAWYPLGTGLRANSPTDLVDVWALVADRRGGVYVGGNFRAAGGLPTPSVARWTGTAWEAVGAGLPDSRITALAIAPNGDLYAAGEISLRKGYSEELVMRWDGRTWSRVGGFGNGNEHCENTNSGVFALVVAPNGELYAGGVFMAVYQAGVEVPARNIARWDGTAWHALTPTQAEEAAGNCEGVHSLAFAPGGNLYVAGDFAQLGGVAARNVARWDGAAWHALGSGLNGPALSVASVPGGRVVVGGRFTGFGDARRASFHIAVLGPNLCQPLGNLLMPPPGAPAHHGHPSGPVHRKGGHN
ncbi:hypothetical protein [Hymenobacter convexus]|uniref:hypothetical protein n=1 Tax=Hymenobacter sp. CA1UV-4 TaxID=3063782 RepID=UPI0027142E00|nr:hypothetical protein [Hymenobacter sp. CA1UV-4]MDO7850391.1 hypothetical protein [Hymenobacter sp. CA1UV-4]